MGDRISPRPTKGPCKTIDSVSNVGGDIDFVADMGMTIVSDDTANTITFSSSGSASLLVHVLNGPFHTGQLNDGQIPASITRDSELSAHTGDTTIHFTSGSINHNDLSGLQGGQANEYYHLENAEHGALVDGGSANGYHTHPDSGSADTLDSVCERGATTDQAITVSSSGSVFNSLLVSDDLQVGGTLRSNWIEYVVYAEHYDSIQAALDDLPHGGGIVMLPSGTIEISSTINILPLKRLKGLGINCSIIKLASGSNCNMIEGTSHFIDIENLTLDGNKDYNSSGKGIYLDGVLVGSSLQNLIVYRCAEEGVHLYQCSMFPVINVWANQNGKDQFLIESGSGIGFYNCAGEHNENYAGWHFISTFGNSCFECVSEGNKYGIEIESAREIGIYGFIGSHFGAEGVAHSVIYMYGECYHINAQNIRSIGTFTTGNIIHDDWNSYYIPTTEGTCVYNSGNQCFGKKLILDYEGAIQKYLQYVSGSAYSTLNHNLFVDGTINTSTSGSTFNSLFVEDELHVMNDSYFHGRQWLYADDQFLQTLQTDTGTNFDLKGISNSLIFFMPTTGKNILKFGSDQWVFVGLGLQINANHNDADAILEFGKPTSGQEDLRWDKTDLRFEFSDDLWVDGTIEASGEIETGSDFRADSTNGKGVIVKDKADGTLYRICVISGSVSAEAV